LALRLRRNGAENPDKPRDAASESGNQPGVRRLTGMTSIMMKRLLFTAAIVSLTLLGGCAKGGGGPCAINCASITVTGTSNGVSPVGSIGLNLPISFSVAFVNTSSQPVNWNITGTSCTTATDSSNPCGYFTSTTTSSANFQGPSSVPSDTSVSIVATSQTDGSVTGTLQMNVLPDIADVNPVAPNVGVGLAQQYTAVALPDQAPQQFLWSCQANGVACQSFSPAPNQPSPGLATYNPTAGEECSGGGTGCVTISAVATVDPTGCTVDPKNSPCVPSQTTVVSSRVTGTYAFQFSGFDKNGKPVAVAGVFTADANGGSIAGFEDQNAWNGSKFVTTAYTISGGTYNPISAGNANSNNAGTLTLSLPGGVFPNRYQVVLDGAGDIQMIESDGQGSGSGIAEPSSNGKFNKGTATFAFGFTGVDSVSNRIGYAGLLQTDGVSSVTAGLIDVNDNGGSNNSICDVSAAPCSVSGTYGPDPTRANVWNLSLTASGTHLTFDFFVANGSENSNGNNPLYLYAISTDNNPAMLGTMTFQNPKITTYNNAALVGNSVSALTGANGNVALVLGSTDGSSDSKGNGNFTGTFDWNNAGTIVSVPPSAPCTQPTVCAFGNTYISKNGNLGRYTLQMLGNPNANPATTVAFVLYASGANRGYLLDTSSSAVFTGTMNAQTGPKANFGIFTSAQATGTYAAATNSNSAASLTPVTMNLLLSFPGGSLVFDVGGVENQGAQAVTGTYTLASGGNGTVALTSPTTSKYVIYGTTETSYFMMELDAGVTSPLYYLAQ